MPRHGEPEEDGEISVDKKTRINNKNEEIKTL
jgi:hypothetical protein